ncbi:MAG TPA: DRTGG domain-containing protein [Chloroflexota bacterium]|nr:DRTGG domain-containing protein [Chloroflexota bacterium]
MMITVGDVAERLSAKVVAGEERLARPVTGGYVGDLLSCVMAGASAGDVWVTVQGHPNVVAVATLVGISAILVAEGARIDPGTVEKANQEGIPLLSSQKRSFVLVEGLVGIGVRASD